jgi:hypothetical protein
MHMREAIDKLMADFNKFLQDNAGFKGYLCYGFVHLCNPLTTRCSEGAATLNDMKDMLANLPQYQEMREKVCREFHEPKLSSILSRFQTVLAASKYGGTMHEHFRKR